MIKKLPAFLVLLVYTFVLIFTPKLLLAAETGNKFGLNVAARPRHVDFGAADFVDQDGWIVMMPQAGDYSKETRQKVYDEINGSYFSKMGSRVNYVLRAHEPHANNTFPDKSDSQWSDKWSSFWGQIINQLSVPAGSTFYFMPWNEPNLQRECNNIGKADDPNDSACAPYVLEYLEKLEAKLDKNKVKLLTPMFANSAPNFYTFVKALGGADFLNRFDGIALALYDFETGCTEPFCNPDPRLNPNKYPELLSQLGVPNMPLFILETGLVSPGACGPGVPDCPNFSQPEITKMLCQLYNNHKDDPILKMFSPLTYDPELGGGNWFWNTPETQDFYKSRSEDCSLIKRVYPEKFVSLEDSSLAYATWEVGSSEESETTTSTTSASGPTVNAAELKPIGSVRGAVTYSQLAFPAFDQAIPFFSRALRALLPVDWDPEIQADTKIMTATSLTDALALAGEAASTGCEGASKHQFELKAERWGKVLAAVGLNAMNTPLFWVNQDLVQKRISQSFRLSLEQPDYDCQGSLPQGAKAESTETLEPEQPTASFFLSNLFASIEEIVENWVETIGGVIHFFTKLITKEETKVAAEVQGKIAGAETANKYSHQLGQASLPASVAAQWQFDNQALTLTEGSLQGEAEMSPGQPINEPVSYDLAKTRNALCVKLCSLYPAEKIASGNLSWLGPDKLCPSCVSEDYKPPPPPEAGPKEPVIGNDPPLDESLCHDDGSGACNYYACDAKKDGPGCLTQYQGCGPNQDPVCENGVCNPYEWNIRADWEDRGCPVPYGEWECTAYCILQRFEKKDGGYGSCHYTTQDVCVRPDREATGNCAAVCNWNCCQ